jgi:hypothetical protein
LFFVGRNDIGDHGRILLCLVVVAIDAAVTGVGIPIMNNDDDGDDDDTKIELMDAITNRPNVFVLISAHAYFNTESTVTCNHCNLCCTASVRERRKQKWKQGNEPPGLHIWSMHVSIAAVSVLYPKNDIVLRYNANSSTACMFLVVTSFLRLK